MHHQLAPAPIILVNPRHDGSFRRAAERALASGAETPTKLQQVLRSTYPRVKVNERELSGELANVWYVYREGRWIGSPDPELAGRDDVHD